MLPKTRKRKAESSDDDSPDVNPLRQSGRVRPRIRKGGAGADVEMSNIFEKILNKLKADPMVRVVKIPTSPCSQIWVKLEGGKQAKFFKCLLLTYFFLKSVIYIFEARESKRGA